ncbi:lysoplasmalogenase family protein, partial [Klebsiella pneumoniae]|uniref:lysoplasmalogenase family protein n=1 Tax=Klebsiella pneumoniae TaxID=573 RepID=UPI0039691A3A
MLWSFIAVCFSAWLYVDASYRGPAWRRWVFKPVTLILLLLLAWQAPMFNAISYLVLAGLCASLLGDALTLLPRQRCCGLHQLYVAPGVGDPECEKVQVYS